MKRIILAITLTAFTLGAFAGEACCPNEKAAVAKNTTACSTTVKAACADKAATAACSTAKGNCAHVAAKKVQSPKAASQS